MKELEHPGFIIIDSSIRWNGSTDSHLCPFYDSYLQKQLSSNRLSCLRTQYRIIRFPKPFGTEIVYPRSPLKIHLRLSFCMFAYNPSLGKTGFGPEKGPKLHSVKLVPLERARRAEEYCENRRFGSHLLFALCAKRCCDLGVTGASRVTV